jgi:hypothetical protein
MPDPIQKITKEKKGWDTTQVAECLPKKCKALNSIPSTEKKKKREGQNNEKIFYNVVFISHNVLT